jgi:hypothetical protein
MSDPLTILATAAALVILVTMLLARVIPDDYDRRKPSRIAPRGAEPR